MDIASQPFHTMDTVHELGWSKMVTAIPSGGRLRSSSPAPGSRFSVLQARGFGTCTRIVSSFDESTRRSGDVSLILDTDEQRMVCSLTARTCKEHAKGVNAMQLQACDPSSLTPLRSLQVGFAHFSWISPFFRHWGSPCSRFRV